MMRLSAFALLLASTAVQAAPAHQDWVVRHQPDRFVDRVMMEAWADADKGAGRMALYCDTESGFRVMFLPHRALMPEGPSQVTLTIDDAKPVVLQGDAFGDDQTDVVTVHDTNRIQAALSRAHHVAVKFQYGPTQVGDDAFTFGDLSAQRETLMKVCPLVKARSAP
jgi:hypothetical protein